MMPFQLSYDGGSSHSKTNVEDLKYVLELNEIQKNPIANTYVIPKQNNLKEWDGIIFANSGYYKGGIFRFSIQFSSKLRQQYIYVLRNDDNV